VLAGTIAAISIHVLLTALGVGAGLAIIRPMTDSNPGVALSAGTAMVWSLFAIIAWSFGGWVAGRLSACPRSGLLHGVVVWGLALIVMLPWLALGSGLALRRAMNNHADNLRVSRQAVTVAADDLAKTAAKRTDDQLGSFVEEAVQSVPTNAAPKAATRAEREVGFAVTTLFAPGNAAVFQTNRQAAITTLMAYTDMNAADATTTIDSWTMSHKNLLAELEKLKAEMNNFNAVTEQKASATADALIVQRAQHLCRVGRWSFFSLLIGLLGASLGGRCGARCASRNGDLPCAPGKPV
jgi:hypothetical protein